jgi:urease subunit beta
MTDHSRNPFANPQLDPGRRPTRHQHASDDPGRDYPADDSDSAAPSRSSGPSGPSEPRRAGTGERQAVRRQSDRLLREADPLVPGEILHAKDDVPINVGMPVTTIRVENTADRPIQVGSHFHFAEVNGALQLDRQAAWGQRLNVVSGGSVRFEPGAAEEVQLVPIRGRRIVLGLRGLCAGSLDD